MHNHAPLAQNFAQRFICIQFQSEGQQEEEKKASWPGFEMRWSQVWLCLNKLCAATVTPKLDRLPDKPSDKDKGELLSVTLHEISYLRNIWSKCLANEAKSNDKDMTRPPTTAVKRALFRRHSATKKGAKRCETAKLVEPIQTAKKQFKFYVSYVNNSKTCLFES